MNQDNCPEGFFSDELFAIETGCRQSRTAWIVVAVFIGLLNMVDVFMISQLWARAYCTRRAYSRTMRRDFCCKTRLPITPVSRLAFLLLNLTFIVLASFDLVTFRDGSSVAVGFISLLPLFVVHFVIAKQYLRLGETSVPLAKRLMSKSSSGLDLPTTPSSKGLNRTPSMFTFGARDISKLSPIGKSVIVRFYVWSAATVARLVVGVIFAPIFPAEGAIVTAAFSFQLLADVCISFMVSQLGKSIKAMDEILKTSSSSPGNGHAIMGRDSRCFLLTLQYLIALQIALTMGIHALIVAGIRSWFVVFLEPASLSIFHVLHTMAVYNHTMRSKRRGRTTTAGYYGDNVGGNHNLVSPAFALEMPQGGKPADNQPLAMPIVEEAPLKLRAPQQRSTAKGVRSENPANVTTTGDESRAQVLM